MKLTAGQLITVLAEFSVSYEMCLSTILEIIAFVIGRPALFVTADNLDEYLECTRREILRQHPELKSYLGVAESLKNTGQIELLEDMARELDAITLEIRPITND